MDNYPYLILIGQTTPGTSTPYVTWALMSSDNQIEPLEEKRKEKNLLLEAQQCSEGPK